MDVRQLLPHVNVSKLLSHYPHLIFRLEPGKVSQQLHLLRSEFSAACAGIMLLKKLISTLSAHCRQVKSQLWVHRVFLFTLDPHSAMYFMQLC